MFVIDKICPKRIADAFRWSSAIQTYPRQYFATSGSWSQKMLWKLLRLVILPWFCKANALAKCRNRTHWNGNRLSREIWRFRKGKFMKDFFPVEYIGYDGGKKCYKKKYPLDRRISRDKRLVFQCLRFWHLAKAFALQNHGKMTKRNTFHRIFWLQLPDFVKYCLGYVWMTLDHGNASKTRLEHILSITNHRA